jgi:hypothetical protein
MVHLLTAAICLLWGALVCGGDPPLKRSPLSEAEIAQLAKDAKRDPSKLAPLVEQVSRKDGRRLLRSWIKIQDEENPLPITERNAAFVKALPRAARAPDEILEVMGGGSPKTVVRQFFYRRYREQWIFEHPLRCCVVFDCVRGKDFWLLSVLPLPHDAP